MSNTSNVMEMMEKYSTNKEGKATKEINEKRVQVGNVFMQPTKKNTNYKFCYFGTYIADEEQPSGKRFVAGFNMSNKAMLEMVQNGMLSQDFAKCFEKYATTYHATETVL